MLLINFARAVHGAALLSASYTIRRSHLRNVPFFMTAVMRHVARAPPLWAALAHELKQQTTAPTPWPSSYETPCAHICPVRVACRPINMLLVNNLSRRDRRVNVGLVHIHWRREWRDRRINVRLVHIRSRRRLCDQRINVCLESLHQQGRRYDRRITILLVYVKLRRIASWCDKGNTVAMLELTLVLVFFLVKPASKDDFWLVVL